MMLVYEVEKSLAVKTYSHPLGEQLEEINTVEELQEIVLEIRKSNWNCSGYYYIQTRNINSTVYDPFPILPCTPLETNPTDTDIGSYYFSVTFPLILITYYIIRKRKNK